MSLEADQIVDRRTIRRKLTFWRVTAALIAIAAIIGTGMLVSGRSGFTQTTAGSIARVMITGLIRSNQERVDALDRLGRSSARAVIVHINSPGGTASGAEELHGALLRLKEKKPLVVVVDGLAASGGYITAIAADHIVSLETSMIGSIGVLLQYPNVAELMQKLGIKVETIRSTPLKAAPSGYEPTDPAAIEAMRGVVLDTYAWFRGMVKERRGLDDAVAWLARERNIDPQTPVRDYPLQTRFGDLPFLRVAAFALDAVGLGTLSRYFSDWSTLQTIESLNLDGVLALWHPPATN
jgi:protease-4